MLLKTQPRNVLAHSVPPKPGTPLSRRDCSTLVKQIQTNDALDLNIVQGFVAKLFLLPDERTHYFRVGSSRSQERVRGSDCIDLVRAIATHGVRAARRKSWERSRRSFLLAMQVLTKVAELRPPDTVRLGTSGSGQVLIVPGATIYSRVWTVLIWGTQSVSLGLDEVVRKTTPPKEFVLAATTMQKVMQEVQRVSRLNEQDLNRISRTAEANHGKLPPYERDMLVLVERGIRQRLGAITGKIGSVEAVLRSR